MKTSNSTHYSQLVRKNIRVMMLLIMAVIFLLTATILCIYQDGKNEAMLVGIFNRQRMLIQQMTKDANLKYAYLKSVQDGPLVETPESLSGKIGAVSSNLNDEKTKFEKTLQLLHTGNISADGTTTDFHGILTQVTTIDEQVDESWSGFAQSLDVMIASKTADSETARSLIYINAHNEGLLKLSDDIVQMLITDQKQVSGTNFIIVLILCIAAFSALICFIFRLRKFIIAPLDELYSEIDGIALFKKNSRIEIAEKSELAPVINRISSEIEKSKKLIGLIININQNMSFEGVLSYIYKAFSPYIPYSHIGIALLKDEGKTLEASYGVSDPSLDDLPKKLLGIKVRLKDTSLTPIVVEGTPRVIGDLKSYVGDRYSNYNIALLQAGIQSSITLPLKINEKPFGVIFFSSTKKNAYSREHVEFLEALSSSIAISFNKNIFIDELLYSTILALAKMVESRDEETKGHMDRMKQYSKLITQFLLWDSVYRDMITVSFIRDIERFSPMHDIGKVGVRDSILLKPGKLTQEEFEEMKKHTIYGGEVLRTAEAHVKKYMRSIFQMGIEIAEGHHEKWDGTGYPYGKREEEIPLSARIVAAADVFDALTSRRPYKPAFSFDRSLKLIADQSGRHFDPQIVNSILRHKKELYTLYESFQADTMYVEH